jgi:peptidoglycan/LPS O-acetylase OafA/YrhL
VNAAAAQRDPALDGVRGLAIGMILLLHGFAFVPGTALTQVLHAFTAALYIGVDLFFVLSGFLITSILLESRGTPQYFRNFYARRALRIFPAYYLVLAVCYLLRPLADHPALQAQMDHDAPFYALYLQNLMMAWRGHAGAWIGLDPTWSLAIEEQYYLIWPAVVALTPPRHLLKVCLAVCAGSMALKWSMDLGGVPRWTQYVTTPSHAEGLALGSALAAWIRVHGQLRPAPWQRGVGAAATAIVLATHPAWEKQHVLHTLIASIAFAWILFETLAAAPQARVRRALEWRPLALLGRYSYGLYLWHYPIVALLGARFWLDWKAQLGTNGAVLALGCAMLVITAALAVAMFHLVGAPALRLKQLFPRRG